VRAENRVAIKIMSPFPNLAKQRISPKQGHSLPRWEI
jgi:hypothetical protein